MGQTRERRTRRDRSSERNEDGEGGGAGTSSQQRMTTESDQQLIRSYKPQASQMSRRALLQSDHAAFASIHPSQYREETQHAGASSAAACIVLEMPTVTKPSRARTVKLVSDNRKRRGPVPVREVQRWRAAGGGARHRFKPVYTHQFFTDEQIQGYRPTDTALEEARSASRGELTDEDSPRSHPSFSRHDSVGHTLSVQVRLAPSGRKCCLILEVGKAEGPSNHEDVDSSKKTERKEESAESQCALPRKVSVSLSDGASCDGYAEDDEGDFELKNSSGGDRKRSRGRSHGPDSGGGQQKKPCPEGQGRGGTTAAVTTGRITGGSQRTRSQAGDSLQSSSTMAESEVARGKRCLDGRHVRPPQSKRPPLTIHVTDVSDVSSNQSSDEEAAVALDDGSLEPTPSCTDLAPISSSTTPPLDHGRMKIGVIITQIAAGLPETAVVLLRDESVADGGVGYKILSSRVNSIADVEDDYLDHPVGKVIREYSREKTNMSVCGSGGIRPSRNGGGSRRRKCANGDFVLCLADMRTDGDARRYHDEVEKIAPWFIEIASCVEVGLSGGVEPDGGYWKVVYLFERHRRGGGGAAVDGYSLVGYVTLFFHDLNMTVCQAVCLPPYQRNGHGTEMLMAAYEVNESREILVHSPAPAFVALRNRIDYATVSELIDSSEVISPRFTAPQNLFAADDAPLPDEVLADVGSKLGITPQQVANAFDIWMLGELEKSVRSAADALPAAMANQAIASMEASYKSMVKRTLLKALRNNHDELDFDSMETSEQKEHLEELFNQTIVGYRSILK